MSKSRSVMYLLSRSFMLVAIAALCLCRAELQAAIVMQVSGITGDSRIEGKKDWIDLYSYQQGMATSVTLGTGTGGPVVSKPVHSDITLSKNLDRSSVPIALKLNTGTKFATVVIEFLTSGSTPKTYYRITLSDAYFTSLSTSSGGDQPVESVSIFYSKIMWEYFPNDPSGVPGTTPVKGEWNVLTGTGK